MKSHIAILAGGKPMTLPQDFSISVEMSNPLFHDSDLFSYPVELPVEGNRHVLKDVDDVAADMRPIDLEHTPMQIYLEGMPFASGPAVVQENERTDGKVSVSIDASTRSFSDLISDMQCNEVPIPERYRDSLLIGEKIDEVNVQVKYATSVTIKYQGKKGDKKHASVGSYDTSGTFHPQALGFSFPGKCKEDAQTHVAALETERSYPNKVKLKMPVVEQSYINVSVPYPDAPFCNARVCYGHYALDADGTTSSSKAEYKESNVWEDYGPIWALEADRPQSGICFYVLFFLDCLFEHLGLTFDNSALTAIEDFRRLCFFTTKCAYDTRPLHVGSLYTEKDEAVQKGLKQVGDIKLGYFQKQAGSDKEAKKLFDEVNQWLDSRGCGGTLSLENPRDKSVQEITYQKVILRSQLVTDPRFPNPDSKKIVPSGHVIDVSETVTVGKDKVASIITHSKITGAQMSASVVNMYANEKNFPQESVSSVIDSLEHQFGIKFYYDYDRKHVTAYLIRDVFRKQAAKPRTFHAQVLSMVPVTEKITGVRVGYSAESDRKEQKRNVTEGVKDYDTNYDYIDYKKGNVVTSLTYREIIRQVHEGQQKLFIDLQTGNKYRVKINSEFTNAKNMEPRLFEVATYKGVEIGDCSDENEDYVQEFISDFSPVVFVDVNYRKALDASNVPVCFTDAPVQPVEGQDIEGYVATEVNGQYAQNVLAAFVDEDMEHEFVKQYIKNTLSSQVADFYVTETLSLRESYDTTKTDDGNSPLQSHDWGLSVAIMRGGGVDSTHEPYAPNYDGFGNSKWRTVAGKYALSADTIDCYGNGYDYNYNGSEEGSDSGERFSLKPRAWVQPDWADAPLISGTSEVKNRGYVDAMLIDYIHFLLHRKKYYVECLAPVAQIADIQEHWREWWMINGRKCLIDTAKVEVSAETGVGKLELEVYSL